MRREAEHWQGLLTITLINRVLTCLSTVMWSVLILSLQTRTVSTGSINGGLRITWVWAPQDGPGGTIIGGASTPTISTRTTGGRPTGSTSSARAWLTNLISVCATTQKVLYQRLV